MIKGEFEGEREGQEYFCCFMFLLIRKVRSLEEKSEMIEPGSTLCHNKCIEGEKERGKVYSEQVE